MNRNEIAEISCTIEIRYRPAASNLKGIAGERSRMLVKRPSENWLEFAERIMRVGMGDEAKIIEGK